MIKIIKILEQFKRYWVAIAFVVGLFGTAFAFLHNNLNKYDELLENMKTTQQMSLKSVIWNQEIPIAERTSACDVYLSEGYNSLTKKLCEKILDESEVFNNEQ